jgi:outer membrane protein assembly factor BamB
VYIAATSRLSAVTAAGGLRWSVALSGTVSAEALPVIGPDGTVYQPTSARIYAVVTTGAVRWSSPLADSVGLALGADGTLLAGSWNTARLRGVDAQSGAEKWSLPAAGAVANAPAIAPDGTVYFGTWSGSVVALDARAGGPAASAWPLVGRDAQHTGRAGP